MPRWRPPISERIDPSLPYSRHGLGIAGADVQDASQAQAPDSLVVGDGVRDVEGATYRMGQLRVRLASIRSIGAAPSWWVSFDDSGGSGGAPAMTFRADGSDVFEITGASDKRVRPQISGDTELGSDERRFKSVYAGQPFWDVLEVGDANADIGTEGYVIIDEGAAGTNLLDLPGTEEGRQILIDVIAGAGGSVDLRRTGGATINGVAADLTIGPGLWCATSRTAATNDWRVHQVA